VKQAIRQGPNPNSVYAHGKKALIDLNILDPALVPFVEIIIEYLGFNASPGLVVWAVGCEHSYLDDDNKRTQVVHKRAGTAFSRFLFDLFLSRSFGPFCLVWKKATVKKCEGLCVFVEYESAYRDPPHS
jgi:hypothetical protein